LFKAYALAVFEVDSRYKQHGYWQLKELIKDSGKAGAGDASQGFQCTKFLYSCKPADALFSG
jgi:hypothetical protein